MDLDPGDAVEWEPAVEAALRMRHVLKHNGFNSWPKLTCGKGIHLMAPLDHPLRHDGAHWIARRLVSQLPPIQSEFLLIQGSSIMPALQRIRNRHLHPMAYFVT
jgi:DNA primase